MYTSVSAHKGASALHEWLWKITHIAMMLVLTVACTACRQPISTTPRSLGSSLKACILICSLSEVTRYAGFPHGIPDLLFRVLLSACLLLSQWLCPECCHCMQVLSCASCLCAYMVLEFAYVATICSMVLPLHMLLAWQIRRHHEPTITLCRYTSSRFLKMCLSNELHLHGCLSAAVAVRRSGHPGQKEVRSSNQADEDRRVALAASRVQQGCALLGSLRGCSWGSWHGGLECWSSGVVSAVSQDSWCMCAIQCVCLCTYWQLHHIDTAQSSWLQVRNGPCVRVLHHAMKSLCPTRSICKDITLLLLLNTELRLSHWSASNAWCVEEGCPTTLCIGAL